MTKMVFLTLEFVGFALVEMAFKFDCWGPFAWAWSAGNKVYGRSFSYGLRHGFYVPNPYANLKNQPRYVRSGK